MSVEPKEGTQHYEILQALRTGKVLTGLDGLKVAQSMKLSSRIGELKKMGHNIKTDSIRTDSKKRISRYWLSPEPPKDEQSEMVSQINAHAEEQANTFFAKEGQLSFIG